MRRELRIASRLILDATRAYLAFPFLFLPRSKQLGKKVSAYRMKKRNESIRPSTASIPPSPRFLLSLPPFFHPFTARYPRGPVYSPILVLISQELLTYDGIEQLAGLRGFFK